MMEGKKERRKKQNRTILFSNGMQIAPLIKGTRNQLSNDRNKVLSSELFNLLLSRKNIYIYFYICKTRSMFNYRCYAIHDYRSRCAGNENRSSNDTWHFSFRFYLFDCRFGGNLVINETFKVSSFCLQQRRLFTELLSSNGRAISSFVVSLVK